METNLFTCFFNMFQVMMSYFDFTAKMHSTMLIIVFIFFFEYIAKYFIAKNAIHRQEQDKTSCR